MAADPKNITSLGNCTADKEIEVFKRRLYDADPLLGDLRASITALSVLAGGQFAERTEENAALMYLINQATKHGQELYAKLYPGGRVY